MVISVATIYGGISVSYSSEWLKICFWNWSTNECLSTYSWICMFGKHPI